MNRRHWTKFILTLIVLYWIESLILEFVFYNLFKKNLTMLNSLTLIFYKPTKEEQRGRFWYHFFQLNLIWIYNVFIYSLFFTDLSVLLLTLDQNFFPRLLSEVFSQSFGNYLYQILMYIYFTNKVITYHEPVSPEGSPNGSLTKDLTEQELE